jgi:hypothetical protein
MSVIPSKRVDRIFPVIPPLCLLLAAQLARRNSCGHGAVRLPLTNGESDLTRDGPVAIENKATLLDHWTAAALIISILFAGGYTTWKVVTGYRDHRNALATFAREVRRETEARHWRYEVVSAKDEGLLLYLQKTHYIQPDRAAAEWNAGNLDALVASMEKAAGLMPQLRGATVSQLKSTERKKEQATAYVFITR